MVMSKTARLAEGGKWSLYRDAEEESKRWEQ